MTDVVKFIKEERKKQHLSQAKVAWAAQVTPETVCAYEKYRYSPKFEIVESMLNFLGFEIIIRRKGSGE